MIGTDNYYEKVLNSELQRPSLQNGVVVFVLTRVLQSTKCRCDTIALHSAMHRQRDDDATRQQSKCRVQCIQRSQHFDVACYCARRRFAVTSAFSIISLLFPGSNGTKAPRCDAEPSSGVLRKKNIVAEPQPPQIFMWTDGRFELQGLNVQVSSICTSSTQLRSNFSAVLPRHRLPDAGDSVVRRGRFVNRRRRNVPTVAQW